jgi:hypothetical protein
MVSFASPNGYRKKINLSTCLAAQAVGIKEVHDGIWLVSFMDYDLGYIDREEKLCSPLKTHSGQKCYPGHNLFSGGEGGIRTVNGR